ncbi:nuclear transport factor 2 family protein [Hymenobacter sp. BRD128]|uniref:YybH family protein n=1 Tax=Hymenobacter sp. BRD128 TaxID=2675878 RepID=UPI0015658665|nr:nuclear transport factor 2 family protein [Hymenobacter sp. BRD128]QKG55411.1 nuclear transport factor 2 family protein [Hymenobacter sp. BRD128]
MKFYLLSCGAAALLTACSGNGQSPAAGSTAAATTTTATTTSGAANVSDLDQQFVSAWNNKDATKVTAMLADDVQFLQGATHFVGKAEVTNKWITPTIGTIANLKTYSVSSGSDANLAYEAGTFSVDVLPTPTEKTVGTGTGNYVFAWKKANDGSWKISMAHLEDLPVQEKK